MRSIGYFVTGAFLGGAAYFAGRVNFDAGVAVFLFGMFILLVICFRRGVIDVH